MKRRACLAAWIACLSLALVAEPAAGDCGSIPFEPDVRIFEPNQRALIAWNGTEEILVLSTDLSASRRTKVLEVIPLPSKPTVRKGDVRLFQRAVRLINEKLRKRRPPRKSSGAGGTFAADGGEVEPPPAGEVVFHDIIGASDVSVTHALRPAGFVDWVEKHLRQLGVRKPEIPEPMRKVVGEYLADGFTWFVFNVVSLGRSTVSKQALVYRFRSDCLYYPLRITRTESGRTSVRLLILTRGLIDGRLFTGVPRSGLKMPHRAVRLNWQELRGLDQGLFDFLGTPASSLLRIWEIEGELSAFKDDVLAGLPFVFYLKQAATGKLHGPYAFLHKSKVQIGERAYVLHAGNAVYGKAVYAFDLVSIRRHERHGPFRFADRSRIRLGGAAYTLLKRKLPPVVTRKGTAQVSMVGRPQTPRADESIRK